MLTPAAKASFNFAFSIKTVMLLKAIPLTTIIVT